MKMKEFIKSSLNEAKTVLELFLEDENNLVSISKFCEMLVNTFQNSNTIFTCGNGGSMCDAMHFSEEWTGRFRRDRKAMPAIAISDPSHITCTANDYGFQYIFSRVVEGLGKEGDLLLGISTSGNSQNIIEAVSSAADKKMKTVCLLGKDGGKLKETCDLPIIVPAETSDRIQEVHIKIIHIVIETVERKLFPELYND